MAARIQVTAYCDILSEFKRKLENDWKRTNFEGKHFYVRDDIYKWMKAGETSNVVLLLRAVNQRFKGGRFPEIQSRDLLEPSCLIVFAILLSLDYGHLIQIFHKHTVTDERLRWPIEGSKDTHEALSEDLDNERHSSATVISSFEERKWAFIPVYFRHLMHEHLPGVKWVLPFTRCDLIAEGGTARVYQVLVHQDLLDQNFRNAIHAGKQTHELLRDSYEFAVKEYRKVNERDCKREWNAFRAIHGQEGMVHCLGQIIYDKMDGDDKRETTYNILLEFGEFDLDQFFGDQQQYPPVLQPEIVRFWESFFKVADAISRVHNLVVETEDGQKEVYRGWHADIKPENILRVYGEFKLADFGFATFSDRNWGGNTPTSFIDGGTATFGAPETDSERRGRGTLTPVTQTIDTWSFGCVLSITATWLIFGIQGVYQYRAVRQAAISKLNEGQKPSSQDAFHDGSNVLPAVKQWHQVLRASMRRCDPITDKVLDLIEDKMLVASPTDRIECKELCKKLGGFLADAHRVARRPETSITQDIMATLLDFDLKAPSSATDAQEIKVDQGLRDATDIDGDHQLRKNLAAPNEPLRARSRRFSKQNQQVMAKGKFAHRTPALQSALETMRGPSCNCSATENNKREGYEKAYCTRHASHARPPLPRPIVTALAPKPVHESSQSPHSVENTSLTRSAGLDQISSSAPASGSDWQNELQARRSGGNAAVARSTPSLPALTEEPGNMTPTADPQTSEEKAKVLPEETDYRTAPTPGIAIQGPSNNSGQPFGRSAEMATPRTTTSSLTALPVGVPSSRPVALPKSCPRFSPYHHMARLDEAICKERMRLDEVKTGFFGRRRKDESLKDLVSNRDFVFVVDRAPSMAPWWEWVTFIVETLALKLARLDDDGLDLVFTSGSEYNLKSVKDAAKFRTAMGRATPNPNSHKTDMSRCLGDLSRPYLSTSPDKQLTLIIFTDGMWGLAGGASSQNPVDKKIVNFIKELTSELGLSKVEDRWFSIQFISFATDPRAQEYLDYLDSGLSGVHKVPDVIDTKPWNHEQVHNLILGSFDPYADEPDDDAESPAVDWSSQKHPASLLPPSGSEAGPTRSKSRRKSGLLGGLLKKA